MKTPSGTLKSLLLAWLLLWLLQANAAMGSELPEAQARDLVCKTELKNADANALVQAWMRLAEAYPESPYSELALRLAANRNPLDITSRQPMQDGAQKILSTKIDNGNVRDRALLLLAACQRAAGDFAAAEATRQKTGELDQWLAIGPFGRFGHANFQTQHPPENSLTSIPTAIGSAGSSNQPAQAQAAQPQLGLAGSRDQVYWRKLAPNAWDGRLHPFEQIHPRQGAALYLSAIVESGKAEAILHIDAPGAWMAWIDGSKIGEADRLSSWLPRDTYCPVNLEAGAHRIVIKLYDPDGDGTIRVRLINAKGQPLAGVAQPSTQPEKLAGAAAGKASVKPAFMLNVLWANAQTAKDSAPLAAALALAYIEQNVPDRALRAAETACELDKKDAVYEIIAGLAADGAEHLPLETRASLSRKHYQAALSQRQFAAALIGLAELELADGQQRAAVSLLEKTLQAKPGCFSAQRRLVEIAMRERWTAEARKWLDDLRKLSPAATATNLMEATVSTLEENTPKAIEASAATFASDQSQPSLWRSALETLERAGNNKEAEELIQRMLALAPGNAAIHDRAAQMNERFKNYEAAAKEAEIACTLLPESEQFWKRKGDILLMANEREQALTAYRESLHLSPGQDELRRLICSLEGKQFDFWTQYAADTASAIKQADKVPLRGSTVRVIDQSVIEIYPDGSRAEITHEVQKVLTESGISAAGQIPIMGEVLEARTILPGGQSMEPVRLPQQNAFTMPSMNRGVAVEYRYLNFVPARFDYGLNAPSFYFRAPDSQETFLLSQYIIRVPEGFPFAYAQRNFDTPPRITTEGGYTTYAWTMRNMEKVTEEEGMPNINEILPYVEIGSKSTWADVNAVLAHNYLKQIQPTVELEDALRECAPATLPERERIARLYRLVLEKVAESKLPGGASATWARRSGDRTILLLALLRMAGVDARFAAIRPNPRAFYEANWDMPQADHFPLRAVAAFPADGSEPIWLDLRYRYTGCGQILDDLSGATAFVTGQDGGSFRELPQASPAAFGETETLTLQPSASSPLDSLAAYEHAASGERGGERKEDLIELSERERLQDVEKRLAKRFGAITLTKLELPGLEEAGTPCREKGTVEIERFFAPEAGGACSCGLALEPLRIIVGLESDPLRRENPFRISEYLVAESSILINPPEGMEVSQLPRGFAAKDNFGHYSLTVTREGKGVRVTRRYAFAPQLIPLENYPRLHALARNICQAEQERIIFKSIAGASAKTAKTGK